MKYRLSFMDENFIEKDLSEIEGLRVRISETRVNEYINRIVIDIANNGSERKIIPFVEVSAIDTASFYMIPCVNYNGNTWGTCEEPKHMQKDGKPWIFSSDRVGLPGCSIAENNEECIGLFADNEGLSKNSSASIFEEAGKIVQRLYFSHIEYPYVYLRKFVYDSPLIEYVSFANDEEKRFVCYLYRYQKSGEEYYGYKQLFDYVNGGSFFDPVNPPYTLKQVTDWDEEFLRSLTEKTQYGYLSNMGFLPNGEHRLGDETAKWCYRKHGKYEIGWCGQNITVAGMYLRMYLEKGNPEYKEKGIGILQSWLKRIHPCGLMGCNYDVPFDGNERIDTCNEGWFLYRLILCCKLLKQIGESVVEYEDVAKKVCKFFVNNYPDGGFPQILNGDGKIVVKDGCAGVMLMLGFAEAYEYFGDVNYLVRAEKAFKFYYETYLSKSVAAGGALDTYCIDKESAGPVLRTALKLFAITGKHTYFAYAENIAHYLMTWCFYHDVEFVKDSDCSNLGVRTTGGTSVSAAHHHIDCWGAFYVPDFYELYQKTNNVAYLNHARALWTFTIQYISDGNLKLHGMVRPRGAQNEAVIQCNWHQVDEEKGQLNDWMVTWVKTFQLDVIYALKNKDGGSILE